MSRPASDRFAPVEVTARSPALVLASPNVTAPEAESVAPAPAVRLAMPSVPAVVVTLAASPAVRLVVTDIGPAAVSIAAPAALIVPAVIPAAPETAENAPAVVVALVRLIRSVAWSEVAPPVSRLARVSLPFCAVISAVPPARIAPVALIEVAAVKERLPAMSRPASDRFAPVEATVRSPEVVLLSPRVTAPEAESVAPVPAAKLATPRAPAVVVTLAAPPEAKLVVTEIGPAAVSVAAPATSIVPAVMPAALDTAENAPVMVFALVRLIRPVAWSDVAPPARRLARVSVPFCAVIPAVPPATIAPVASIEVAAVSVKLPAMSKAASDRFALVEVTARSPAVVLASPSVTAPDAERAAPAPAVRLAMPSVPAVVAISAKPAVVAVSTDRLPLAKRLAAPASAFRLVTCVAPETPMWMSPARLRAERLGAATVMAAVALPRPLPAWSETTPPAPLASTSVPVSPLARIEPAAVITIEAVPAGATSALAT